MEKDKLYPIGGYAPGSYMCSCCLCQAKFFGDKRAVQCESCATRMEILSLRGTNIDLEAKVLSFFSLLKRKTHDELERGDIVEEYQTYFGITNQREGKI